MRLHINLIAIAVILLLLSTYNSSALTIDEAISLAKENLPSYKASLIRARSTEELYKASLSPYLPTLDASAAYIRHNATEDNYTSKDYNVTLSYNLFDGGRRKASRSIALLNLGIDEEDIRRNLLDLEFGVKGAFYTAVARRDILQQREIQLQDAQKDFEVAEGRYKFGVAKFSDVLQASVRLEQASFNLIESEGEFKKALSELSSLMGVSLDSAHELKGSLDFDFIMPDRKRLSDDVLQRPEINQSKKLLRISEDNKSLAVSSFYPNLFISAGYSRTEGGFRAFSSEDRTAGITAVWNLFELGKFFRHRSAELETGVSQQRLSELKRQLLLDLHNTLEDYLTAFSKLRVAEQQLKQSEHNYLQAFEEYKVGKGDILSLVQAESLLANAREQLVNSKLSLILTRSRLERVAGVEKL